MKIIPAEDAHVKHLFKQKQYGAARDFLLGRQNYYQQADTQLKCPFNTLLAKTYSALGEYAKADDHLKIALNTSPHNYEAWLETADSYLRRGDLKRADITLRELNSERDISQTVHGRQLLSLMGRFFQLSGEYESAYLAYGELQRISAPSVHTNKELAFAETMINEEAVEHVKSPLGGSFKYAHHLHLTSKNMGTKHDLGVTFLQNRMKTISQVDLRVQCYQAMAYYCRDSSDISQALTFNRAAYELDKNNIATLDKGLRLLLLSGDLPKAREHFKRDHFILSEDPAVISELAKKFFYAGVLDISKQLFEETKTSRASSADTRQYAATMIHAIAQRELRNPA